MCMAMDEDEETAHLFAAKLVNVNILASLLKSVSFTDKVNVLITKHGIKFTVEEGKYVQASALLPRGAFEEYTLKDTDSSYQLEFRIPMKELLNFLKIFTHVHHSEGRFAAASTTSAGLGAATLQNQNTNQQMPPPAFPPSPTSQATLLMHYAKDGSPLALILDESATITDFYLRTEEPDDLMELEMDKKCQLILKPEPMRDFFTEIESNAPESLKIKVVPQTKLQLSGKVMCGSMKVTLPASSTEVIEDFDCDELTKASYRFSILRYCLKALHLSDKIALKIGADGLLGMSFLMAAHTEAFVEFYCMAQVPEEELND